MAKDETPNPRRKFLKSAAGYTLAGVGVGGSHLIIQESALRQGYADELAQAAESVPVPDAIALRERAGNLSGDTNNKAFWGQLAGAYIIKKGAKLLSDGDEQPLFPPTAVSRRNAMKKLGNATTGVVVTGAVAGSKFLADTNNKVGAVVALERELIPHAQDVGDEQAIAGLEQRKQHLFEEAQQSQRKAVIATTLIGAGGAAQFLAGQRMRVEDEKEKKGQGRG